MPSTQRLLELCVKSVFFGALLIPILLSEGCSGGYSSNQNPVTVSVAPTSATVALTKTQQFTATVSYATNTAVTWQVNGTAGGSAATGTISASGMYTAPTAAPNPATVTVTAVSEADPTKSGSAVVTLTAPADTTAPSAPSGLTVTGVSSTTVALSWTASTDNVGVTGYKVERCSGASCTSFIQIGTTSGPTAFGDSGLTVATAYRYRVRATDAAGNLSGYSNVASATTSSGGGSSITVSVTPKRGGLVTSQTLALAATLTNDTTNAGVTWSVIGGGSFSACSAPCAAVTFTAPSSAGLVTITATSVVDATKSASAAIGVTDLTGVLTYHNNISRDGTNQKEYALTTANVTTATFGKRFSCNLDGAVYAQPLWVPKVSINGGTHNIILAVSMRDSVYAFDADASPCVNYWTKTLIPSGETWGSSSDVGSGDIQNDIGILGTPVIDSSSKTVYLVSKTKSTSGGAYHQRLHALNLSDGTERTNSPVSIDSSITVAGNCEGGSTLAFDPLRENQRAGLALAGGTVYITWASHGDVDPYHGWVIGYRTSDLSRVAVFNASPNQAAGQSYCRSGIWMAGGAPAIDASNNVYVLTGNGTFDLTSGGSNYGDSLIKLSSTLTVSDWFTPFNQSSLDASDLDLGSGGAVVLVDLPLTTSHPHLLVGGGKGSSFNGEIYVLDRDNLGHIVSNDTQILQRFPVGGGIFATEAFWQNTLFIAGTGTHLKAFSFDPVAEVFNTSTVPQSANSFGFPGATPSVSSLGSTAGTGIVWALDNSSYCTEQSSSCGPTVLHAYSATNVATELWNSTQGTGNTAGNAVKFTVPTVANGKVYVPTRGNDTSLNTPTVRGRIDVYGLLP